MEEQTPHRIREDKNWVAINGKIILAEVVSTAFLMFLGCMACIPIDGFGSQPPLYGPLGFGLVVMLNIQIFGHVSGAQMNPAVTLASMISGLTPIPLGIAFFFAQCIGSILGYGILLLVSPVDLVSGGICLTLPHVKQNVFQALTVEIILTIALAFVNCAIWDLINIRKQDSVPIRLGLAVAGLSIAGGPVTGASMNPARSLGPALWSGTWDAHWIYWVGPLMGGAIAALLYKYIWYGGPETEKKPFDDGLMP